MDAKSEHSLQIDTQSSRVLIIGCGYLGAAVGRLCSLNGDSVYASTRTSWRAKKLAQLGFQPIIVDWNDRRTLKSLPSVDRVLVAVSYDASSSVSRYESQVGGLSNFLKAMPESADLCYVSTTGVYHQSDGQWVDERSATRPTRDGGKAHLQAEQILHRDRPGSKWTILRMAGLYGPGRVPRIRDVLAGRAIASREDGYLNLIHISDAARAVLASWNQPSTHRLYVVSDDLPMLRGEFYREIARQCHAPPPRFVFDTMSSSKRSRSEGNKRIWNRRLKRYLLNELRFPTYKEGLQSIRYHQNLSRKASGSN